MTSRRKEFGRKPKRSERIFLLIRRGALDWLSSEVLTEEVRQNPSIGRRSQAKALLSLSVSTIKTDAIAAQRAQLLASLGYGILDALHVAAAESARVDVMLSTDDRLLKRAARGVGAPLIPLRNPLFRIQEQHL